MVLSLVGLVVVAPVLAIAAVAVKCSSPGPVIFTQQRAGQAGKPFRIWKLRTMVDLRDDHGNLLPDEDRIAAVGRFLRTTSIDELPQLLNILKGDMSFIGPRALPVAYLPRYTPEQMRRHDVPPGMGSYADIVLNRSVPSWETVFQCDVWYVDHWSIWLDARLFLQIAYMVITRKGAEQGASGQMPEFRHTDT